MQRLRSWRLRPKEINEIKYYIDKYKLGDILPPEIMTYISIKTYKKNSLILEADKTIENLYFLLEGKIEVNSILENGKHIIGLKKITIITKR